MYYIGIIAATALDLTLTKKGRMSLPMMPTADCLLIPIVRAV